jgi:hypothetical protein
LAITAVGVEVEDADPCAFRAVTWTRSVVPWSTDLSTYVLSFAPEIDEQLPPFASQRRHWYENVTGCAPAHVPGFAVSVSFTAGLPLTVGGDVFVGGRAWTTPVAVETAVLDPAVFDAVTSTATVEPTSADPRVYVAAVAPEMSAQPAPCVSQRCHW